MCAIGDADTTDGSNSELARGAGDATSAVGGTLDAAGTFSFGAIAEETCDFGRAGATFEVCAMGLAGVGSTMGFIAGIAGCACDAREGGAAFFAPGNCTLGAGTGAECDFGTIGAVISVCGTTCGATGLVCELKDGAASGLTE